MRSWMRAHTSGSGSWPWTSGEAGTSTSRAQDSPAVIAQRRRPRHGTQEEAWAEGRRVAGGAWAGQGRTQRARRPPVLAGLPGSPALSGCEVAASAAAYRYRQRRCRQVRPRVAGRLPTQRAHGSRTPAPPSSKYFQIIRLPPPCTHLHQHATCSPRTRGQVTAPCARPTMTNPPPARGSGTRAAAGARMTRYRPAPIGQPRRAPKKFRITQQPPASRSSSRCCSPSPP